VVMEAEMTGEVATATEVVETTGGVAMIEIAGTTGIEMIEEAENAEIPEKVTVVENEHDRGRAAGEALMKATTRQPTIKRKRRRPRDHLVGMLLRQMAIIL